MEIGSINQETNDLVTNQRYENNYRRERIKLKWA